MRRPASRGVWDGACGTAVAARRGAPENEIGAARDFTPDPALEFYKKDVDRTLLRENFILTVRERFEKLMALQRFAEEMRRAAEAMTDFAALVGVLA